MKRIIGIILLLALANVVCAETAPEEAWNKTFGGYSTERGWSVQQTSDGGYILAGDTRSYGAGGSDFWLVKTDSDGNKEWDKTFGGTGLEWACSVQQTSDGGYILAGKTDSYGAGGSDFWLVKTDSEGNKAWDKTFGGTSTEWARSVQQTSDGGYILAGCTGSYGATGNGDFWLVKTDSEGTKQWDQTFSGFYSDEAESVQQTSDGGYILVGRTDSYGDTGFDFWLVKTDSDGNEEWDSTFGGTDTDWAYSVQQTSDGGYILVGDTESYGAGGSDFWLVKTDSDGNKAWDKTFGGTSTEWARSVQQTSDGGYILAGCTGSYGAGSRDAWLVKTDSDGTKEWDIAFGGINDDRARSVQQTSDGGYVLAGSMALFSASPGYAWLIKVGNAPTQSPSPLPTYNPTPTPSVTVLDCSPSPVHSGEDLDVHVSWANIPADWKLVASLEKAEWDKTRLADDVSMPVSGSGEGTFTLKVYPTTETYSHAKVGACFYKGTEWKHVFDDMGIVVLQEPTKAPATGSISVSSAPSGADIYLDGAYKGTTPTTISDASPGSHTLKLEKYRYKEWLTSVHVTSGVTESITAHLTAADVSPPAIRIDKPAIIDQNNNELLEEGEKVTITYGANDPSGVASIKILLDRTMLESQNQAGTYTVTTNSLTMGKHTIRVEATDSKSNRGFEELLITVERTGPSVYFGTTRTMIEKGEDAIFTLSAVNPIGNPPMTIQLILKPPTGVSVTSSSFAKAGSGIYTCTQTIESGDNVRSIEVHLTGNQIGTHEIASEVYYRFDGSSKSPTRYETLMLIVDNHDSTPLTATSKPSPGFAAVVAITGLLAVYLWRKRR